MDTEMYAPIKCTLAATFATTDGARDAADRLKDLGFHHVWIGLAKRDDDSLSASADLTRVEAENWFQRLFGEGDETLHDALVHRGVAASDIRNAANAGAFEAVVTVDGANHPEEAANALIQSRGRLINSGFGDTGYNTPGRSSLYDYDGRSQTPRTQTASPASKVTAGDVAASDYGRYRGGQELSEERRVQLREERLRTRREWEQSNEAQIGKRVVSENQELDIPVARETLYIERRPVNDTGIDPAAPIDANADEIIRVPLRRETVRVEKDTVPVEEIVIGKRTVTENQRVAATVRKEVIEINNDDAEPPLDTDMPQRPMVSRS